MISTTDYALNIRRERPLHVMEPYRRCNIAGTPENASKLADQTILTAWNGKSCDPVCKRQCWETEPWARGVQDT